jgi:hypothetical protein
MVVPRQSSRCTSHKLVDRGGEGRGGEGTDLKYVPVPVHVPVHVPAVHFYQPTLGIQSLAL